MTSPPQAEAIVERLLSVGEAYSNEYGEPLGLTVVTLCREAATLIERQQKEIEALRSKTIEECAKVADEWATSEQRAFGNGGPAAAIRALSI